jgi:phage repressor protein C with HTH and peptisase S24 domain
MQIGDLLKDMGITQEDLSVLTGIPRGRIAKWAAENKEPPKAEDARIINDFHEKYKHTSSDSLRELAREKVKNGTNSQNKTGEDIRNQKAFGNSEQGLIFVPIAAQAGYTLHHIEPTYLSELETIYIPNMPYKGNKYRIFEVSGDSMEPTLKEHYHVICEYVEPAFWKSTVQYYVYVIITVDRIMIKRLFRKDDNTFVCISDNKDYYPQFILKRDDIKELWIVKRKIDWEMPPPQKVEIEV